MTSTSSNLPWLRIALLSALTTFTGCKEQPSTPAPEPPPAEIKEPTSIYQAPVPELPELSWKQIRVFNLPLNNPPVVPASEAKFLRSSDTVLGVVLGEESRAYSWNLLANFHAVNDHLNGEPIIVNLCEACNGSAAFLATLPETVIDIRPRGLKNGTWYGIDFQTGSLWYPFVGEAFEGPLKGTKLTRIRTYFSSWGDWVRDHPDTTVAVSSYEVRNRPHGVNSRMADKSTFNPAYLKKITSSEPNPNRALLPGHTLVFGLIPKEGSQPKAYTIKSLTEAKSLVQTTIDDTPVLLFAQNRYQIGAYHRILDGTELTMTITSEDPLIMTDQRGTKWNTWGRTISGKGHPAELPLVDGYMAKWYEWIENFPATELIDPK